MLDQAFNWIFDESQFSDTIKIDPRLKNSPVGFCALENDKVIGYVGVMDLVTRTLEDTHEQVGGLYGVATLPEFTRRGVFSTLIVKAHDYFKERGYRFSFLGTSPALVAHHLYEKLGYADVVEYPSAYKVVGSKSRNAHVEGLASAFEPQRMLNIYNIATKRMTGLVVRDLAYLNMLRKVEAIKPRHILIEDEGYVVFRKEKATTWVRELIATGKKGTERLVTAIEQKTKAIVYNRAILDKTLLKVYRSRDYIIQEKGYAVMMCKPLTGDVSFTQTYGDKFFLSRLDSF